MLVLAAATFVFCYFTRFRMLKKLEGIGKTACATTVLEKVKSLVNEKKGNGLSLVTLEDNCKDMCKCGRTHSDCHADSVNKENDSKEGLLDHIPAHYLKELRRLDSIMKLVFENEDSCFGKSVEGPLLIMVQYNPKDGENRSATVELGGFLHELMTRLMLSVRIVSNGWTIKANKRYFSMLCGKELKIVCPDNHSFVVTPHPRYVSNHVEAVDAMNETQGCDILNVPMFFSRDFRIDTCLFRVLSLWDNFKDHDRIAYVNFALEQLEVTKFTYPPLFATWPLVRILACLFCSRGASVKEDSYGHIDLTESLYLTFNAFMSDTANIEGVVLESGIIQKNPDASYQMLIDTLLLFYYGLQHGKSHCDKTCKCFPQPDYVSLRIPSSVHIFDRDTLFYRYADGSRDMVCSYPPLVQFLINAFAPVWRIEDLRTIAVTINGLGVALMCTVSDELKPRVKWVYDVIDAARVDSVFEEAVLNLATKHLGKYFHTPDGIAEVMWKFIQQNLYIRALYSPKKGCLFREFDPDTEWSDGQYEYYTLAIDNFVAMVDAQWYMSRTRNIRDLLQEEDKVIRKKQKNKKRKMKRKSKQTLPKEAVMGEHDIVVSEDKDSDCVSICSSSEDENDNQMIERDYVSETDYSTENEDEFVNAYLRVVDGDKEKNPPETATQFIDRTENVLLVTVSRDDGKRSEKAETNANSDPSPAISWVAPIAKPVPSKERTSAKVNRFASAPSKSSDKACAWPKQITPFSFGFPCILRPQLSFANS